MATGTSDNIAPRAIALPKVETTLSGANYTIGISGAKIVFWTGADWETVTSA